MPGEPARIDHRDDVPPPSPRPVGLLIATAFVVLEAIAPIGFAVWMMLRHRIDTPSNEDVYAGSTTYLIVLGIMLLGVAWGLARRRGWAFGAGVFVQLITLAVVYEMTRASFWAGAVPLGLVALGALVLLFTAPVRGALGRGRDTAAD